MSTSITTAFVKQFEREVHEAYQRLGSKLRGSVRSISNVKGSSAVFQKVGNDIIQVCHKPFQFSCWNKEDPNYRKVASVTSEDIHFSTAQRVARRAILGFLSDPTYGATHYHTRGIMPKWAVGQKPTTVIGQHIFYNLIDAKG